MRYLTLKNFVNLLYFTKERMFLQLYVFYMLNALFCCRPDSESIKNSGLEINFYLVYRISRFSCGKNYSLIMTIAM